MKTIEINLYSFSELSELAKERAIQDWYENDDYPFLSDDIENSITEQFDTEKVFSNIKLSYSLSYSQGDGLSFGCDFNFEKWLEKYTFQNFKKRALMEIFEVSIDANNGRYSYAHKDCISSNKNYMTNNTLELKNLDQLFENILNDIQNYYLEVCKHAERYGYSEIEYRMDEAEFSECCDANYYTFLEDGTMQNY